MSSRNLRIIKLARKNYEKKEYYLKLLENASDYEICKYLIEFPKEYEIKVIEDFYIKNERRKIYKGLINC